MRFYRLVLVLAILAVCCDSGLTQQSSQQGSGATIEQKHDSGPESPNEVSPNQQVGSKASVVPKISSDPEQQGTEFWPPFLGFRFKVTDTLLVAFTALLFIATLALWWATRRLVKGSERTAETQLRPYVSIVSAKLEWSGPRMRVLMDCLNSGQTPATFFEVGCTPIAYERSSRTTHIVPDDLQYNCWSALGAGRTEDIGYELEQETGFEVAKVVEDSLSAHVLMVLGRVRYGDVFGNEYESEFAYFSRSVKIPGPVKMSRATGRLKTYHKTKNGSPKA